MAYIDLDDEATESDNAAGAHIPMRVRANLASLRSDRQVGGSVAYRAPGASTSAASSPGARWVIYPLLIPRVPGATTLHIAGWGTVDATGGEVAAWVEGGGLGAALSVSSITDGEIGVSGGSARTVSLPLSASGRWMRAGLAWKSAEAESSSTTGSIVRANAYTVTVDSATLSDGVAHYMLRGTSFSDADAEDFAYYVGHVDEDASGDDVLTVWPQLTPLHQTLAHTQAGTSGKTYSVALHALGTIDLEGLTWWMSGHDGRLILPPESALYSGADIRAQDWRTMQGCARAIYDRGRVWSSGLPGVYDRIDGSGIIGSVLTDRRPDGIGARVAALVCPGTRATSTTLRATYGDAALASGADITTSDVTLERRGSGARRDDADPSGTYGYYSAGYGSAWGGRGLPLVSDMPRMELLEWDVRLDEADSATEGNRYALEVSCTNGNHVRLYYAIGAAEIIDTTETAITSTSDGWTSIDGEPVRYPVQTLAPIYGGEGITGGWRALVDATRECYTTRVRSVVSWESTAGVTIADASYARYIGPVPLHTSADGSGEIDLTTWGDDVDVRVTVYDTSDVSQGTITTTHAAGSVSEDTTAGALSLSADTLYYLDVEVQRGGASSGTLHAVLITEQDPS